MDNKQEQRDEIQRKIRELDGELTGIRLQDGDWNDEREKQLEDERKTLQSELDKLS